MTEKDMVEHGIPFLFPCPDCSIFIALIFEML